MGLIGLSFSFSSLSSNSTIVDRLSVEEQVPTLTAAMILGSGIGGSVAT